MTTLLKRLNSKTEREKRVSIDKIKIKKKNMEIRSKVNVDDGLLVDTIINCDTHSHSRRDHDRLFVKSDSDDDIDIPDMIIDIHR